jgi:hypothetical protein
MEELTYPRSVSENELSTNLGYKFIITINNVLKPYEADSRSILYSRLSATTPKKFYYKSDICSKFKLEKEDEFKTDLGELIDSSIDEKSVSLVLDGLIFDGFVNNYLEGEWQWNVFFSPIIDPMRFLRVKFLDGEPNVELRQTTYWTSSSLPPDNETRAYDFDLIQGNPELLSVMVNAGMLEQDGELPEILDHF